MVLEPNQGDLRVHITRPISTIMLVLPFAVLLLWGVDEDCRHVKHLGRCIFSDFIADRHTKTKLSFLLNFEFGRHWLQLC